MNRRMRNCFALLACLTVLNVAHAQTTAGSKWYVGIGGGISKFDPDMGDSGFELDSDSDRALSMALGLDISRRYSIEFGATELGKASLGDNRTVSYRSAAVSTLLHVVGNPERMATRQGLWGYARLGVNRIDNSGSTVNLTSSDSTAFQLGAGVEWAMTRHWSLRSELIRYDRDAQSVTVSLLWRNRLTDQQTSSGQKPQAEPDLVQDAPKSTAPINISNSRLDAADGDCAVPAPGEPLNDRGCAIFSGISDITFVTGSDQLQDSSLSLVKQLASNMLQYNSVTIEIGAHSVSPEGSEAALILSRMRAFAVARALVSEGVPVNRLQARAFGDSVQWVAGADPQSPLHNRIVLKVITTE